MTRWLIAVAMMLAGAAMVAAAFMHDRDDYRRCSPRMPSWMECAK